MLFGYQADDDVTTPRRHPNIVAVALANKNARVAWSLLTSDDVYDTSLSVGAA